MDDHCVLAHWHNHCAYCVNDRFSREGERFTWEERRNIGADSNSTGTKHVGIVVGGGPAPGINGTIGAVTLEAGNRGHDVIGIYDGFSHLMAGRTERVKKLDHDDVSRIHF